MSSQASATGASSATMTIATRGSELALWQARRVRDLLIAAEPGLEVELTIIKTKGDKILDVPLAKVGGKGLFVKEIEQALLDGRADLAVHSMKDVPAELEKGLHLAAIGERGDPRDAFCSASATTIEDLPKGARVGTSSLRRMCQLRVIRPDLKIESLRGNVPTRLAKLEAGDFDAILLAVAGLERLGLADRITSRIDTAACLPAVGQAALGVETRQDDERTTDLVRRAVHNQEDALRVRAERAFLARVEGGCQAPLAALAELDGEELRLEALVGRPDGTDIYRVRRTGPRDNPEALGVAVAEELLAQGAGAVLEELIEAAQDS